MSRTHEPTISIQDELKHLATATTELAGRIDRPNQSIDRLRETSDRLLDA